MKTLAVGDSHGNPTPLAIARRFAGDVDKIVFIGDYVDSFDFAWREQRANLDGIIQFKDENPDKVVLLLGNHDLSYLSSPNVSGHQAAFHDDIKNYFLARLHLFDIVHAQGGWLFSHAGVTQNWLDDERAFWGAKRADSSGKDAWLLSEVNAKFHGGAFSRLDHRSMSPTGDDPTEGPLWVRPRSLVAFGVRGFNQIVGHTAFELPAANNANRMIASESGEKFVFIDSLNRNVYALVDEDAGEIEIGEWRQD